MISRFISSNTCPAHFRRHCLAPRASSSASGAPLPKITRVTPCLMTTGSAFTETDPKSGRIQENLRTKHRGSRRARQHRARRVRGYPCCHLRARCRTSAPQNRAPRSSGAAYSRSQVPAPSQLLKAGGYLLSPCSCSAVSITDETLLT